MDCFLRDVIFFRYCRVLFAAVVLFQIAAWSQLPNTSSASAQDLEQMAKQRGYSDQQIASLKQRYASKQPGTQTKSNYFTDNTRQITSASDTMLVSSDTVPAEEVRRDSLQKDIVGNVRPGGSLAYFGYSLFRTVPDAFKPTSFGPIDPGYIPGPGDVLRLSVWGEVEFQYELRVDRQGKIFIPVAGQIHVAGTPFEKLHVKIQSLLSKHYSGLATNPQKSFMDLSIAQLKPIRIFVMGEVKAPGGYTVATSSTAFNAFYAIGGPLETGSLRDVKVLRNKKEIASIDMYDYFTTGTCSTDVRLQNDDVLFVPRRLKTVAVTGAVFRTALYELKTNEDLNALLYFCGGVLPGSNTRNALIRRVLPVEQRIAGSAVVQVVNIDLQKQLLSREEVALCDNDTLHVTPLADDLRDFVTIEGAVYYPGMYQCDSLSLYTLIFMLGKPIKEKAFVKRCDLVRRNSDNVTFTTIPIDLEKLQGDPAASDRMLQPFDKVIIYEKEVEKPFDFLVSIEGEVRKPGEYIMSSNFSVVDAILRAGGFTRAAFTASVDVYRIRITDGTSDTIAEVYKVALPDTLSFEKSAVHFFELKDRDKIVVRQQPGYTIDNYVVIDGMVRFRGTFALKARGERLSDLVGRAGGTLPDAFLEGSTIIRNGMRLIVNFREVFDNTSSKENILLLKRDSIFIPARPNTVLITGNVNNPGLFSYAGKAKLRSYIDRAGGFADSTSYILLSSPIGETSKIGRNSLKNPVVLEGSEITVLRKPPKDRSNEKQGPTITEVVRDTLAILASAVTIIGLAMQMKD